MSTRRRIPTTDCIACEGSGYTDHGVPDSPDGPGSYPVSCVHCNGTGWRNGVHRSDQALSPVGRQGMAIALNHRITTRTKMFDKNHLYPYSNANGQHGADQQAKEPAMQQIVHLALSPTGRVMAQFDLSSDAAEYCLRNDYTHVPYNLNNRDKTPAPLIGDVYRA